MQCKCGGDTQDRQSKNSAAGLTLRYAFCPGCTRCGAFRLINSRGQEIASGDKARTIFNRANDPAPEKAPEPGQQSLLEN